MAASIWYLKSYPYNLLVDPDLHADCKRTFYPGEMWHGEEGREQAFVIQEGHLRLRWQTTAHERITVAVLNPTEIIGTLAANAGPTEIREEAVAMDACTGYLLDRDVVERRSLTVGLPLITINRRIGWRMHTLAAHPDDLLFRPLTARLADALLSLQQKYPGKFAEGFPTIACTLHPRHLADLAGSSTELTRMQLEEWEMRGWLDYRQGRITLRNLSGLRDLAQAAPSAEGVSDASSKE